MSIFLKKFYACPTFRHLRFRVFFFAYFPMRFLSCAISFLFCLLHFLFHLIQMVLMVNLLILRAMVYFGFHKSSCNLQACPLFAILRIFSLFFHHLLLLLQLRFNHWVAIEWEEQPSSEKSWMVVSSSSSREEMEDLQVWFL